MDSGYDTSMDSGYDTSVDSGYDTSMDSGYDTSMDSGAGTPSTYSAWVEVDPDGVNYEQADVTVTVTDHAGNVFTDTVATFLVDNQNPRGTSVEGSDATDTGEHSDDGITNADSVQFTVVFDEPVTQVGMADFEVTTTGDIAGATVSGLDRVDDVTYTVTVSGGNLSTGDGDVSLNAVGGATIYDRAGNTLAGSDTGTVTVDNTGASVVEFTTNASGPHKAGEHIKIVAEMSEYVQGGGITVTLNNGADVALHEVPAITSGDYTMSGFEGASAVLGSDPDDADNQVVQFTKHVGAKNYAGVTIGLGGGTVDPVPVSDDMVMAVRMWVRRRAPLSACSWPTASLIMTRRR